LAFDSQSVLPTAFVSQDLKPVASHVSLLFSLSLTGDVAEKVKLS